MNNKIFYLLSFIFIISCTNNESNQKNEEEKEKEELNKVDEMLQNDQRKIDSLEKALNIK